ncbi:MAG: glycosyltransferase family 39 protein [Candidatus Moraniibacteriota bacterium]
MGVTKKTQYLLLFLIIIAGFSLRAFKHQDWLLFQSDQSRDAMIIEKAEGEFGGLPLLGPQASSSVLKLGPVFYYFQFAASELFGVSPAVLAWPDLFFGVLSIAVFFFLMRKFFTAGLSLALTSLYSVSYFLIVYDRFAWNPNSIPFFLLLLALSLINSVVGGKRYRWLFLAGLCAGVLMQLHFVAFFLAPALFITFLVINFKEYSKFLMALALLVIPLVNLPVLVYDYKNEAQNSKALLETFRERTSESDHNLAEKFFRGFQEASFYNWAILTGDQKTDPVRTKRKDDGSIESKCDKKCENLIWHTRVSVLLFLGGLFLVYRKRKEKLSKQERVFLNLFSIWIILFTLIITPVAYEVSPRFFLALAPFSFFLLGLVVCFAGEKIASRKIRVAVVALIFLVCYLFNLGETIKYFKELSQSNKAPLIDRREDKTLPNGEIVTLEQMEKIAKIIKEDKSEGEEAILIVENRYARSIFYLLKYRLGADAECYLKMSDFEPNIPDDYYYVVNTGSEDHFKDGTLDYHNVSGRKKLGTLILYKLSPKRESDEVQTNPKCRTF